MGKKEAKKKKELKLEYQMNLASDLAERNPRLRPYWKKYPNRFIDYTLNPVGSLDKYKEFDDLFSEIYGDRVPKIVSPVLRQEELEQAPHEMILRIDLNYTTDEIMHRVEGFIKSAVNEYHTNHQGSVQRKHPAKWMEYLEIWDLKDGSQHWIKDAEGCRIPPAKKTKTRPLTFEEIAKYINPDMDATNPEELVKAIDRVKKQYQAAYKLIMGNDYNPKQRLDVIKQAGSPVLCDQCKDRDCEKNDGCLCPAMEEHLQSLEVTRKELLVDNTKDLENFTK